MKAAEFFMDRFVTAKTEGERLKVIRDIQVDALKGVRNLAFGDREFAFAMSIGSAAEAIEALGEHPTPVRVEPQKVD